MRAKKDSKIEREKGSGGKFIIFPFKSSNVVEQYFQVPLNLSLRATSASSSSYAKFKTLTVKKVDPRFYVIGDSMYAIRQIVGNDFLSFFGCLVLIII